MSVLTGENFVAIAAILNESNTKDEIVRKLAEYFKNNNPRFDTVRFLAAVGRVSPFREAMGRAVGLNQELEEIALGQVDKPHWLMVKSIRGLWELADTESDRDTAIKRGQRIANFNPGKEVFVLQVLEGFLETGLERVP